MGTPLELIKYNAANGKFEVGTAALDTLRKVRQSTLRPAPFVLLYAGDNSFATMQCHHKGFDHYVAAWRHILKLVWAAKDECCARCAQVKGPVAVVAVCGRARQGKSFILNQLLLKSSGGGFQVGFRDAMLFRVDLAHCRIPLYINLAQPPA